MKFDSVSASDASRRDKNGAQWQESSLSKQVEPLGRRSGPPSGGRFAGLGRIIGFFLVLAVFAYVLDATISFGLRRIPTSKFGSLNRVVSGRVNADVVINGSSRALTHYDPRVIHEVTGSSAYNLGMNGVQIDVQLAILKTYLKRNSKPKIVIQNLESFSFEVTRQKEIYDPALYLPFLGEEDLYRGLLQIDPAVWKWKHIPLHGYAVEDMTFTWVWGLLGCVGIYGRENYFDGFNPRYVEWTEDFERFKASVGAGVNYRIEPKGVEALKEIIATCRANGIDLILVYSPVYYEMQRLEQNRAEIFATFQRLSDESGVPMWDYSTSPIARQRSNFYNSQHLNARGAALFSTEIALRLAERSAQRARTLPNGPP